MISPIDASILAITKLRTRRMRTSITVVISGLLFAGLTAALLVEQGSNVSIHQFSKEGLNSRYIVQASADPPIPSNIMTDTTLVSRAQQIYNQTVSAKKAAAKNLGITYDSTTETLPTMNLPAFQSQAAQTILNFSSPSGTQALQEYVVAHPGPGLNTLKQVAAPYNPIGFYSTTSESLSGSLSTMKDGVENFNANQSSAIQSDILQSSGIEEVAPQLASPFLIRTQPKNYDKTTIPVILPYSKAEQLLGLAALPKSASPNLQLDRIKDLYSKASSITFSACFRNSVSEEQISTAITQAADIAKNANNKDYQKPTLIYGLPDPTACAPATILSDTRTKDEKTQDAKQDQFTQMFGGVADPAQQKLTFRVIGLTPDQHTENGTTISTIIQSLVSTSLDNSVVIPSNMLDQVPNAASIRTMLFSGQNNPLSISAPTYYAEFSNADDARHFINAKSCTTQPNGRCSTTAKPFQLSAYGSNSIALQDLQNKFNRFFGIAAIAVTAVATVIMAGTVGRMLADGRKETAVFRAIGAKRLDITLVYGIYTVLLSVLVAVAALLIGIALAYALNAHYAQTATAQAQLAFGGIDTTLQFHIFGFTNKVYLVSAVAVASGLISMCLPLVRNVRRNPIKDMRDE